MRPLIEVHEEILAIKYEMAMMRIKERLAKKALEDGSTPGLALSCDITEVLAELETEKKEILGDQNLNALKDRIAELYTEKGITPA